MPTHEGWLKGINSTLLTPENDMGRDAAYAISGNPNALIGRDVFGLSWARSHLNMVFGSEPEAFRGQPRRETRA